MSAKHSLVLITFLQFSLVFEVFGYQKAKVISIDASIGKSLNLSEIAESVEMIVLENSEKNRHDGIDDLIITEGYIFASAKIIVEGKHKSKVLQFDRKGSFIRQLGNELVGWVSLIYNPKEKTVGANINGKASFYDFNGNFVKSINTLAREQIHFNNQFWGVKQSYADGQVKYTLQRSDSEGSNTKEIFEFYDKTQGVIGFYTRFSAVGDHLYFWDSFSNIFYEVKKSGVEPRIRLETDMMLKTRHYSMIKGDWIIVPALHKRRRVSILKIVNLTNGNEFSIAERLEGKNQISGVLDDISGAGFLRLHVGTVYGTVDNKLVFMKKKNDVPQLADSSYSDKSDVIFLATLK
jgi:hypothetical protein